MPFRAALVIALAATCVFALPLIYAALVPPSRPSSPGRLATSGLEAGACMNFEPNVARLGVRSSSTQGMAG